MSASLRAGAGRAAVLVPTAAWPLEGFAGEHDPLHVRVLVLATERRIVMALVDQTSLASEPEARVRAAIAAAAAADPADVVIIASHTFSAPHLHPHPDADDAERDRLGRFEAAVLAAATAAARDAVADLRPACVGTTVATCRIGVNRDVETAEGWALGVAESGPTDPEVPVVLLVDDTHAAIAVIAAAAVQPAVMHGSRITDGTQLVTADLAGAAAAYLETHGLGVAFCLTGAAGDQTPILTAVRGIRAAGGVTERRDAGMAGFVLVDLLGERLGEAVRGAAARIAAYDARPRIALVAREITVAGQQPTARERVRVTRVGAFSPAADERLPYWLLSIGDAALAGFQVELSAATGAGIRSRSPFAVTAVVSMVNGAAKYLPEASAFDRFTYEAQSSRYASGAAEAAAEAVVTDLTRMFATPLDS